MEIYFTKDAAAKLNTNKAIYGIIMGTANISLSCAKIKKKGKFYRCRSPVLAEFRGPVQLSGFLTITQHQLSHFFITIRHER